MVGRNGKMSSVRHIAKLMSSSLSITQVQYLLFSSFSELFPPQRWSTAYLWFWQVLRVAKIPRPGPRLGLSVHVRLKIFWGRRVHIFGVSFQRHLQSGEQKHGRGGSVGFFGPFVQMFPYRVFVAVLGKWRWIVEYRDGQRSQNARFCRKEFWVALEQKRVSFSWVASRTI